jgi:hypothetical protein
LEYARILKDQSGAPSGYRECGGQVAWMPRQESYQNIFRQVKLDLKTMVVLNHDFIKDSQRVYRTGTLLRGISPEGFRVFNKVYTGNHQVIYTLYGDAKVAHPASFEALDDGGIPPEAHFHQSYGRDEEFVYFFDAFTSTRHAVRLRSCKDPKAFVVLSDSYAKDDRFVYCCGGKLKADPKTFQVLSDGYARDCRRLFRYGVVQVE